MIASKPTVLSATVFPPCWGPVTTMIWNCTPRWTSIGTTERTGSVSAGCRGDRRRVDGRDRRVLQDDGLEQRMPGLAKDKASLVIHVRGRHQVIQAEPGPGVDQVELGHDRQGLAAASPPPCRPGC